MAAGLSSRASDGQTAGKIRYMPPHITTTRTLIKNNNSQHFWGACCFPGTPISFICIISFNAQKTTFRGWYYYKSLFIMWDKGWQNMAHGPNPSTLIHLPTMTELRSCEREHMSRKAENIYYLNLYSFSVAAMTNHHKLGALKPHKCIIVQR